MRKIKYCFVVLFALLGVILSACSADTGQNSETTKEPNQENESLSETEVSDQMGGEKLEDKYYFSANEGGSISKIDSATNQVVSTIDVEGSVHNVQVSPDGKVIGATVVPGMNHGNGDSMEMKGQALFLDTESNELLETIEVGNHPAHIVFTETGKRALVTNNEDNSVSVIDMTSYKVTQTIETGKGPHGFRISPNSQKAYIANIGEDTVSVVSLETMKEEKRIKVGTAPVTTGVTSDGKLLVATINEEDSLAIVDLETDQVDKVTVGKGPAQVYIDGENQYAYVANQGTEDAPSNSVSVIDLASKRVISTIETGNGSHGVVTSTDNKRLYVTNMYENSVSVIDTEKNIVVETIEVGEIPNGISIMK
jgi:YVTN family beta-propeller protein